MEIYYYRIFALYMYVDMNTSDYCGWVWMVCVCVSWAIAFLCLAMCVWVLNK